VGKRAFGVRPMSIVNKERLKIDEMCRARAAIPLLTAAVEMLVAADRQGPKSDDNRLFPRTRPLINAIERLSIDLVRFADQLTREHSANNQTPDQRK